MASTLLLLAGGTPAEAPARFELIVLGIAQDGGVPHLGCEAACCAEARAERRVLHPASIAVHDRQTGALLLVEATPAVEAQVALLHAAVGAEGRGRRPVDALLLTHAHIGHYLGLAHLGREVASVRELPVHVTPRLGGYLAGNGPWSQLVDLGQIRLETIEPGIPFEPLPGLAVTAVAVPHRDEFSDTVAFRIRGSRATALFVPDIDGWDRRPGLLDTLLEDVDVAYLDATFYDGRELPGRDKASIPHPMMTDTMDRLGDAARAAPGRFRFIHLNHSNPALVDAAIREDVEARGFRIAEQGERIEL